MIISLIHYGFQEAFIEAASIALIDASSIAFIEAATIAFIEDRVQISCILASRMVGRFEGKVGRIG